MRKYICLFICMMIFLTLLAGCKVNGDSPSGVNPEKTSNNPIELTDWNPSTYETVNNFDGVTMTVKEGTETPTGLTVVLENSTDRECIYGEYFDLEKKINESWYTVPVSIDGNYGFSSIGYGLSSGDEREWSVDWNWLYGSLKPGEYRIIKDILDFRGTGDYDTYYLAAEFTIN